MREERVLQALLKAWLLKYPHPVLLKCLPMFQMVFLNVDVSGFPINQFILLVFCHS